MHTHTYIVYINQAKTLLLLQVTMTISYRAAAWIEYYRLLSDIIGYFPYSFKIHELPGGKNVWK